MRAAICAVAAVAVFLTFRALVAPAEAYDIAPVCGIEEHVHAEACFAPALICDIAETGGHIHSDACYEVQSALICALTEDAEHIHSAECFVEQSVPVCGMEELPAHSHGGECFASELVCAIEEHVHAESCYPVFKEAPPLPEHVMGSELTGYARISGGEPVSAKRGVQPQRIQPPMLFALAGASVPIEPYITDFALYYYDETSASWTRITEATADVPADALTRLVLFYESLPISALLASGCTASYELNGIFSELSAHGDLLDTNHNVIGGIESDAQTAFLTFDGEWLMSSGGTLVDGNFELQARFDWRTVTEPGGSVLNIGGQTLSIDFEDDIFAKHSSVTIEKTNGGLYTDAASGLLYIDYALTVTAPEEGNTASGVPDVWVEDVFTGGAAYIDAYDGIPDASTAVGMLPGVSETVTGNETSADGSVSIQPGGRLRWDIGGMARGETRTLAYRVTVDPSYAGGHVKGDIVNAADVYSAEYIRDTAVSSYAPDIAAAVTKTAGEYVPDSYPDGWGRLTYTIAVSAPASNAWTLDNVKIFDRFKNGAYKSYIDYDEAAFYVVSSTGEAVDTDAVMARYYAGTGRTNPDSSKSTGFAYADMFIGTLAPGETKTVTYDVRIDPAIFGTNTGVISIENIAGVYTDERIANGNRQIASAQAAKLIGQKTWITKGAGTALTEPVEADMGNGEVFTIPRGSLLYTVTVNEEPDWDITRAVFTDTVTENICYVGWLRIDAENAAGESVHAWRYIDGLSTFTLTPADIWAEQTGGYTYTLTYYVRPDIEGSYFIASASNSFELGGTGIGPTGPMPLAHSVIHSITMHGDAEHSAAKTAWYVDADSSYLYWMVKLSGDITPGMLVKDSVPGTAHRYFADNAIVGVYRGDVSAADGIDHLATLVASGGAVELRMGSDYTLGVNNNGHDATVRFEHAIDANTEPVYIVLRSVVGPGDRPTGIRNYKNYVNTLYTSTDGGTAWVPHGQAQLRWYTSGKIFKETQGAFTFDGANWRTLTAGAHRDASKISPYISVPGTYVEWLVHVNWDGTMSGLAEVTESIPQGMELAYVRYYWCSQYYRSSGRIPATPDIPGMEAAGFERRTMTAGQDVNGTQCTMVYYYDADTRTARWDVGGLERNPAGETTADLRAVEFQVVCRVTDTSVLQSCGSASFTNRVQTDNNGGSSFAEASITLRCNTLSKTMGRPEGAMAPFAIRANPLGEDMSSGGTITLVDEMSNTLEMDASSITVTNMDTGVALTRSEYTVSRQYEETFSEWTFVLPDAVPLLIEYRARITAQPGELVAVFNRARWFGYSATGDSTVSVSDMYYEAVGTAITTGNRAKLTVRKLDAGNVGSTLEGAVFAVQTVDIETSPFALTGEEHTAISNADGEAVFGGSGEDNTWLYTDVVYALWEKTAPDGYLKDETVRYFRISPGRLVDGEIVYPEPIPGVSDHRTPEVTMEAFNERIITAVLPATGGDGYANEIYAALALLAISTAGAVMRLGRSKRER